MNLEQAKKQFNEILEKAKAYNHSMSLIYWDGATGAPKKAVDNRAQILGILAGEDFKLTVSEEMKQCLEVLEAHGNELDSITRAVVREMRKEHDKLIKIPADEYREYAELRGKSGVIWEEAKSKSDFSIFEPYLKKTIGMLRKFVEYRGYDEHPYNTLLDDYEPGMTTEKLDEFFGALKEKIVPLVKKIQNSDKKIRTDFLDDSYDTKKQEEFSEYILDKICFDKDAGMLKESEHPFTIDFTRDDVRITTHFYENNFTSAIYSTIHEGGHALYEQNVGEDIAQTILGTGTSMGIHESQSRMYENVFGRDINFWKYFYPKLSETFPKQLSNVSLDEFYEAVNKSENSLIRIEADELTYSLHIMVRYEIEKMLIEGKIEVKDLPKIWNEKIEEYLGVTPPNDKMGVLQDMHWADGLFGYFPSYALGNAYAAQFEHTMRKSLDIDKLLLEGQFDKILEWLRENIHKHGRMKKPNEIIKQVTGEELNPIYFIKYLEKKYEKLYNV
ncbi:carboxypeptidase M32 [Wukongibacter baidiensis]|uniref:carboxypeptidase M32 n=1 Tax=Wukongibacter baidiensis TaxID=1723361 RepID=UPI003D7F76A9